MFADARFIYVQTNDKGTYYYYVVTLNSLHGGSEVPAVKKVEFLANF